MAPARTPPAETQTRSRLVRRFSRAVFAGTLAAGTASLAGFAGRFGWLLELTSHFRMQYFWSLAAAAIVLAASRQWRRCLVATAFAALNLGVILPVYFPASERSERINSARPIRALSLNLFAGNRQFDTVRAFVRERQPDVVALVEFTDRWSDELVELHPDFPHRHLVPRNGNFGVALLSRIPFRDVRTDFLSNGDPAIVAAMAGESPWTLVVVHPFPPARPRGLAARNLQLQQLAEIVLKQPTPVVVLGDLNVTPWSPYFHDLLDSAALHDSRRGFGIQPSWPADNPLLRIPIDHCLATREVIVQHREIGPPVGSDHLPLVVEFTVR